jgi:desulfoferrodoxin-like iron-binding protein
MTATQQVYSCGECGQIVAVVHQGGGRLVCHARPMMLAGEEKAGAAQGRTVVREQPVASSPTPSDAPYWQCSKCHYVLQAPQPPETCPSCHEHCQFVDVTCYIPECAFTGPDTRLIG